MWKRRLALTACVLALCLVGLYVFLGSARVAGRVRDRLASLLGVEVSVASARVGLVGSSSARGIIVREREPDDDAPPMLTIGDATMAVSLLGVLGGEQPATVDLHDAELSLRFGADGKLLTRLPRLEPGGGAVPEMRIHGGRVVLDQAGREPLTLTGLDGTLTGEEDGVVLAGTATEPEWGDWVVRAEYRRDERTFVLRLQSPRTDLGMAKLRRLPFVSPKVWTAVEIAGTTSVDLTVRVPIGRPKVGYRLDLGVVAAAVYVPSIELRTTGTAGQVLVEDGVVHLNEVHGPYAGGRLAVTGRLDWSLAPAQLQFNIKANDVQVEYLPASWKLPPRLEGRVDMTADLLVRLEPTGVQTTGKGIGQITRVVYGGVASPVGVPIRLLAEGSRFRLRPTLPPLLLGGG